MQCESWCHTAGVEVGHILIWGDTGVMHGAGGASYRVQVSVIQAGCGRGVSWGEGGCHTG